MKTGTHQRPLRRVAARLGVPFEGGETVGLICDLVKCPGCGLQVPRSHLKGICDACVAAQTAHEDHDEPEQDHGAGGEE